MTITERPNPTTTTAPMPKQCRLSRACATAGNNLRSVSSSPRRLPAQLHQDHHRRGSHRALPNQPARPSHQPRRHGPLPRNPQRPSNHRPLPRNPQRPSNQGPLPSRPPRQRQRMNDHDLIDEARAADRIDSAIRAGLRHHRRHGRARRLHPACRICSPAGPLWHRPAARVWGGTERGAGARTNG